jgi:hypothetical protein
MGGGHQSRSGLQAQGHGCSYRLGVREAIRGFGEIRAHKVVIGGFGLRGARWEWAEKGKSIALRKSNIDKRYLI